MHPGDASSNLVRSTKSLASSSNRTGQQFPKLRIRVRISVGLPARAWSRWSGRCLVTAEIAGSTPVARAIGFDCGEVPWWARESHKLDAVSPILTSATNFGPRRAERGSASYKRAVLTLLRCSKGRGRSAAQNGMMLVEL